MLFEDVHSSVDPYVRNIHAFYFLFPCPTKNVGKSLIVTWCVNNTKFSIIYEYSALKQDSKTVSVLPKQPKENHRAI